MAVGDNKTYFPNGVVVDAGGYYTRSGETDTQIAASAAELNYLDITAAGTVQASKAVVVDSNKDASAFRNVTVTNLDAGASGTAGSVDIFPTTASKGKIAITATANTNNDTLSITNAAMGQATTLTIPDPGAASASVMLTAGAQTATGNLTLGSGADLIFSGTTGQSEITMTDNLADALSVKITGGADLMTFNTSTGANVVTIVPNTTVTGNVTLSGGTDLIFSGTTGQSEITMTDNLADALSVKITGGADLVTFDTSTGANVVTIVPTTNITGRVTTTDGVASGTAKTVGGTAFVDVAASDTVTAVASNNSFVAFAQSYAIPANTLKAGSVLRARALVVVNDASGTDTLTCEMRFGGTTVVATTAVDPGAVTDLHQLEMEVVSRAAPGAAASCVGAGTWVTNTGGTIARGTGLLAPTNFATNGALTLDVRAKWSSNTASTSARLEMLTVEII